MHAQVHLGVADPRKRLVTLPYDLVQRHTVAQIQFLQVRFLCRRHDHMAELMGVGGIVFGPFILGQQIVQLRELFIQAAGGHDTLHVIDQSGRRPPFGNGALGRIVGIVKIEMHGPADSDHRVAGGSDPRGLARQELQIAVGTDMNDHIRSPDLFIVKVSGQVLMRGRAQRVVEYLADLTVATGPETAPLGLDRDHGIAVLPAGDQNLPVQDHPLARRFAPCGDDLFPQFLRQRIEITQILRRIHPVKHPALGADLLSGGPAELGNGLVVHDVLD